MSRQTQQSGSAGAGGNVFGCGDVAAGFRALIATSLPQQTVASAVNLADDIVHFNTKVGVFYPVAAQQAAALSADPADKKAQQTLQVALSDLAGNSGGMMQDPDAVTASINDYVATISADKRTLVALAAKYDDKEFGDSIEAASVRLDGIATSLNAALAAAGNVKGGWGDLTQTLKTLGGTVQSDLQEALALIDGNPFDEAAQEWAALSQEANNYRVNAYVRK